MCTKLIVFAALVVALAVNAPGVRRSWQQWRVQGAAENQQVDQMPTACSFNPSEWQCNNTERYWLCMNNEECIKSNGIAI